MHFLPYLKFLGPDGLNIPCAVVTDADPGVRTTGVARIRTLLGWLATEELDPLATDDDVIDLGKQHGLFVTDDTFEVASSGRPGASASPGRCSSCPPTRRPGAGRAGGSPTRQRWKRTRC